MGLDIQGGVSVNLKASTTDGSPITAEQMDQTQLVISNRVNASGAAAATIQQQGNDAFSSRFPVPPRTPRPSSTRSAARVSWSSWTSGPLLTRPHARSFSRGSPA